MSHPPKPPRWADWLLKSFCSEKELETLQGDLLELYGQRRSRHRKIIADLCYVRDVLDMCRPFAFRKKKKFKAASMQRHNLLILFRNAMRYKGAFAINIAGLSTGLACAWLIGLWVYDEVSANKVNANDPRLYQVLVNFGDDTNGMRTGTGTPGILADALAHEIPEIQTTTIVVPAAWFSEEGILESGATKFRSKARYVGKNYFKMFTVPMVAGNVSDGLPGKYTMLLSDQMAIRVFGSVKKATGKMLQWMDGVTPHLFHVVGVYKNAPNDKNAADMMLDYEVFADAHPWLTNWGNSDPETYVLLREDASPDAVNAKISGFIKAKDKPSRNTLWLQRLSERYLFGRYENGVVAGGRIEYVRLFSIIGVFILVIACINFMNLSTAKASRRMREIGIKKSIGATRRSLFVQHMEESLLTVLFSLLLASGFAWLLLPTFNLLTGKQLPLLPNPELGIGLLLVAVVTGLFAGSYPALFLSAFKPIDVLKGKLRTSFAEQGVRKGLVVFQFAISILLIVCVVVVNQQIRYIFARDLGYNREHIIRFEAGIKPESDPSFFAEGGTHEKQLETFLDQIRAVPGVVGVANYEHNLTGVHGGLQGVSWKEGDEDDRMPFNNLEVGYQFVETMNIRLLEGRSFSNDRVGERTKIIFNEEAIRQMGLTDPVGKVVTVWGQKKEIIGVAKNFNMESLFEPVRPCLLQLEPRAVKVMVKVNADHEAETLRAIADIYNARNPGLAFDYGFVEDDYKTLYTSELRASTLSKCFAFLAIVISTLGLFALASYTTERRSKEIGIRKILGSTNSGIVMLISGEFGKMILAALVVAMPLSFWIANKWLDNFVYRVALEWWFFVFAAGVAVAVPLLVVSAQTIKAARVSPAATLKEE